MMKDFAKKFKHSVKQSVYRIIPPPYRNYSYAQAGEDVVLDFLLSQVGLSHLQYLEIGVYEPIQGSNTYKFYERGSKGVLVEADPTSLSWIRHARPRDTLVHAGVGISGGLSASDFYIFDARGANTFSKSEAFERERIGPFKIEKVIQVPLLDINFIIEKYFATFPDFLSIDIEGLDLSVLRSLDLRRFPIPIICAETCNYSPTHIKVKDPEIAEYLKSKGYFAYADTYINTLFVNSEWFNNPLALKTL